MESLWSVFVCAAAAAAAVLLAAALSCLLPGKAACRGKPRRTLVWVLVLLAAVLLLWLAGERILAVFGLAWRSWVRSLLTGALGLLALFGIFQTAECYLAQSHTDRLAGQIVVGVSVLVVTGCLVTVGLPGWFLSLHPERTVSWQGQTLLEEDSGFLDPAYSYYEYHGPLVRGLEAVGNRWGEEEAWNG